MLDKHHMKLWVKVVAWGLAIVFGTSFSFLFFMPTGQVSNRPSSPAPAAGLTNTSSEQQAQSLIGQADIALKNGNYDQAADFYTQALSKDAAGADAKSGLADAYYKKGIEAQSADTTAAKDAFAKYLEVSPKGPKASEVKQLLAKLTGATPN